MRRKNNLFRSPLFNILATLLLIAALAFFYKYALTDYTDNLQDNLETIDTGRLSQVEEAPKTVDEALSEIGKVDSVRPIDQALIEFCINNIRDDICDRICEYLENNEYSDVMWEELCGYTLHALYDMANENFENYNYIELDNTDDKLTITFAGDINLDTTQKHWWSPLMVHAKNRTNLLEAAFSSELSEKMLGSDLFCVNLESPFISSDSQPIDNKWRHGSSAENVTVLGTLGIDLVNIANDRIFDYSSKGLSDTLNALELNKIAYIGGGKNLEDARTPRYILACGRKIAIVSAAQAKVDNTMPPEAGGKTPGLIYSTNSTYFNAVISDAAENSDYVIVYTDWENGTNVKPDATQAVLAHNFIEAGADIVIGTKSTLVQSIEYYEGKPIIYGIGNFWYETDKHEALLVEISFTKDTVYNTASTTDSHFDYTQTKYAVNYEPTISCLPCIQDGAVTKLVIGTEEGTRIITDLINRSEGSIAIDANGILTEAEPTLAE